MIGGSCKRGYTQDLSTCDCECNKARKFDEYLDIKNCSYVKRLISKLALESADEILKQLKPYLMIKNNCLIHTISLGIIRLVVSGCWLSFALVVILVIQNINPNKNIYFHLKIPALNQILKIWCKNGE